MTEAYENAVKPLGEILSRGDNPLMNIQMYPCQGYTPWLLGKRFDAIPECLYDTGTSFWKSYMKLFLTIIMKFYLENAVYQFRNDFFFRNDFLEGGGGDSILQH